MAAPVWAFVVILLFTSPLFSAAEPTEPLDSIVTESGPGDKFCGICVLVATQIDTILKNPKVAKSIETVVEAQLCAPLVGHFKNKCISTVEQYVPVILSYVDAELSVDKLCNKTKICTALEDFLANDLSALTYDDPADCLACKLVVKIIRKKLSRPEIQAEIMDFLLSRCGSLTSPSLTNECTKATNDILPVVFEKLPQLLDPKRLCVQAGVCRALVAAA